MLLFLFAECDQRLFFSGDAKIGLLGLEWRGHHTFLMACRDLEFGICPTCVALKCRRNIALGHW